MLSPEISHLVNREQHKDRLRQLEKQQLLRALELQHAADSKASQKAVHWLGDQMVKWGSKLQNYDPTTSPSKKTTVKAHR